MTLVVNTSTTVTGDQTPGTGVAIQYGAAGVTVTIAPGVGVVSLDNNGVYSPVNGSIFVNLGNVIAGAASAVQFSGSNSFIQNEAGRYLVGAYGVAVNGTIATITNYGNILGMVESGVIFGINSSAVSLINRGDIYGRDEGVSSDSLAGGNSIVNEGTIRTDSIGVRVNDGTLATIIDNKGTISGVDSSIRVFGGKINLTNTGILDGVVNCAGGTEGDMIVNRGEIKGEVALGGGGDVFLGRGGKSGDIFGQAGNDSLMGGKGRDVFWGGDDTDKFLFANVKETGKGASRDVIMDFGDVVGEKIDLILIDANTHKKGNQDFKFIGAQKFHDKAGELHMLKKGTFVLIEGDVNGDGKADFQIEVHGLGLPDKGDLLGVL